MKRSIITGKEIEPAPAGFFSRALRRHVKRVNPEASKYRINAVSEQLANLNVASGPSQSTPRPKNTLKRTRGRVVYKGKKEALVAPDGSMSDFARSLGRAPKRWLPRLKKGEAKGLSAAEVLALREARYREMVPRRWAIRHERKGHVRMLVDRVNGYPNLGQRWATIYRGEEVEE